MPTPSAPCPLRKTPRETRAGFALLITITLLAFLVLLLVSLASLTRVETQVATNSQQLAAARQNAIMALNIALGQLQQEAGPDQRVTARAEILDSTPATSAVDGVKQPFWTAVWQTGSAELDVAAAGNSQRVTSLGNATPTISDKSGKAKWLISVPTGTTPDPTTATPSLTVSDDLSAAALATSAAQSGVTSAGAGVTPSAVILAKKVGRKDSSATPDDASNPGYIVAAPLIDIKATPAGFNTDQTIGRYAYWVSDEGIKAKVNLKNPNLTPSPSAADYVKSQLQFIAPSAYAAHKMLPDSLATDFRNNANVDHILTINSLGFLPATPSTGYISSVYSADLTTSSMGVLADVKLGGLKKDLTAALEDDSSSAATKTGQFAKLLTFSNTLNGFNGTPDSGKVYSVAKASDGNSYYYNTYSNGFSVGGLRWLSLYNFYNLYKSSAPYPGTLTTTGTPWAGVGSPGAVKTIDARNYFQDSSNEGLAAGGSRLIRDTLTARVIAWQVHVGLKSYLDAADGRWKLKILLMPALVLYNPYNVKLTQQANFQYHWGGWYNINAGFDAIGFAIGSNTAANSFFISPFQNFSLGNKGAQGDTGADFATAPGAKIDLEPGEIRVYGLDHVVDTAVGSDNFHKLQNFFSPDFYHAIDVGKLPADPINNVFGSIGANVKDAAGTKFIGTANGMDSVFIPKVIPRIRSNDGRFTVDYRIPNSSANSASGTWQVWPQGGGVGNQFLGHMFLNDISITPKAGLLPLNLGPIQNLTNPVKYLTYTAWVKGTDSQQNLTGAGTSTTSTPMPVFASSGTYLNPLSYEVTSSLVDLSVAVGIFPMDKLSITATPDPTNSFVRSYWGSSVTGGDTQIILRDIPRQPLVSLGQFMHMSASYDPNRTGSVLRNPEYNAVGGSWASPFVPRNKKYFDDRSSAGVNTTTASGEGNGLVQNSDDNFLANEKLFDTYFLSTAPSAFQQANKSIYAPLNETFDSTFINDRSKSLPNSHHKFYFKNGSAPTITDLRDFDKAAANLMVDGAFNVNSTSVGAWIALLSSLSGNSLLAVDGSSVDTSAGSPIPRFLTPLSGGLNSVNKPFGAVRVLTDDEIKELAQYIVAEVKSRGPFLSMSDFLNRRLIATAGDPNNLGLYGALQAAIEKAPNVNKAVKTSVGKTSASISSVATSGTMVTVPYTDDANKPTNTATGVPGYLMQQDVVQAFAPLMTVRSDTFTIRCYGENINPSTSSTQGKAWLEAVVQRVPEYVDQSDAALTSGDATSPSSLTAGSVNKTFGRRFKIVSFRWLTAADL